MFIRRLCKQTGTYWALGATPYDSYGDTSYATPVAVTVRYEQRTESFIDTKTGDQTQSRAIVWSADTAFVAGGFLFLGTSVAANPEAVTGADQIRRVDSIPDLKGTVRLYKAYL